MLSMIPVSGFTTWWHAAFNYILLLEKKNHSPRIYFTLFLKLGEKNSLCLCSPECIVKRCKGLNTVSEKA